MIRNNLFLDHVSTIFNIIKFKMKISYLKKPSKRQVLSSRIHRNLKSNIIEWSLVTFVLSEFQQIGEKT